MLAESDVAEPINGIVAGMRICLLSPIRRKAGRVRDLSRAETPLASRPTITCARGALEVNAP
jgi:hypothetical protein